MENSVDQRLRNNACIPAKCITCAEKRRTLQGEHQTQQNQFDVLSFQRKEGFHACGREERAERDVQPGINWNTT